MAALEIKPTAKGSKRIGAAMTDHVDDRVLDDRVRALLADVLGLRPGVAAKLRDDSALFGALPELDSMAVASVLTELEDRLGIRIDDDEVDGDLFASFGALTRFVRAKLRG